MRAQPAIPGSALAPPGPEWFAEAPPDRLQGRALLVARAVWLVLTLVATGFFILSLPLRYDELLHNTGLHPVDPVTQAAALTTLGLSASQFAAYILLLEALLPVSFVVVAAVMFWRKSDEWPPLLFSHLLIMSGISTTSVLRAFQSDAPQWTALIDLFHIYGTFGFFLFAYLFPDGRVVPRWIIAPGLLWLVLTIGDVVLGIAALQPDTWPTAVNITLQLLIIGSLPFAQIYRYRRVANLVERQQTKWVMFGFSAAMVTNVIFTLLHRFVPLVQQPGANQLYFRLLNEHVTIAALLLIPLTVGVALFRFRLWEIDPLINRTLLYGGLTAGVVTLYGLVVGYLSLLFQTRANPFMSFVATGVVVIALQPLHTRLRRGVNRLLYGQRDEPYAVIARLGQRLEATLAPEAALEVIVETVHEALKLPYVAIALGHGADLRVVSKVGARPEELITLPLVYGAETVGELWAAPRTPGEALGPADQQLLGELARQAGAVAHTVRLTADLQRANVHLTMMREQLVLAREEERRRLRRDLHDGLGPALAAQSLKVGAARRLLNRDVPAAERLLTELSTDIEATVADIRRLVYNLRPPALDELGLLGALRRFAATITSSAAVDVTVDAHEQLPALPAAVEVAAFRIVQEALANVVRHADATTCAVVVRCVHQDAVPVLTIEVRDDGSGLPQQHRTGVGFVAMRERAAEVGGSLQVERLMPQGTAVSAVLPLAVRLNEGEANDDR